MPRALPIKMYDQFNVCVSIMRATNNLKVGTDIINAAKPFRIKKYKKDL